MRTLKINDDKFEFFQNWNEIPRKQLLKIANLVQRVDFPRFNIFLFLDVFGFKVKNKSQEIINGKVFYTIKKGKKSYLISSIDLRFISSHFDFLFSQGKNSLGIVQYNISSKLTKNTLKKFWHKLRLHHGPADALTNLTYSEYIHAESNYSNYYKYHDEQYLNKLIAVLFRKKRKFHFFRKYMQNYNGDSRIKFNDFFIDRNAKKLQSLDKSKKLIILWFYEGCRDFLREKFPHVFNGSGEESTSDTFTQFLKITNRLASDDVTKNKQIRETYLYEVMITLEESAIIYEKHQENLKNLRNGNN